MTKLRSVFIGVILLSLSGFAAADPVVDVWTCKLKEGSTAAESQAAGRMWVKVVREITGNDEITSSWANTVVGDATIFMWFDTYPSLEVFAAAQTAISNAEEYEPVRAALNATQTCSGNVLYNSKDLS